MQFTYFSFTRFPSEKTHALYLAKTAESFAASDTPMTIVVPHRFGAADKTARDYYGLKTGIAVKKLPCLDLLFLPTLKRLAFQLGVLTFSLAAAAFLLKIKKSNIVITNDVLTAFVLSLFHSKVVYEMHDYPAGWRWLYAAALSRVALIQTNNTQKVQLLADDFGVAKEKIFPVHNGVTIEDFAVSVSKEEARERIGITSEKPIVMYTGHLIDWKGSDVLADAALELADTDFVFVGGNDADVAAMRSKYADASNITFLGHRPHAEMPYFLKSADVLVVPNTAKSDVSRLHTSPMKIFEYMASGIPILASDLPSIREVLDESNATLFTPDNPNVLAEVISNTLASSVVNRENLAKQALYDVAQYSWSNRCRLIVGRMERI